MVQLFVRNLSSRSVAYEVADAGAFLVSQLKELVQDREGFRESSWAHLGLEYAGRQLSDSAQLADYGIQVDSTVRLVCRLRGGKGGFGALLRGQGRDGKITTNFDACRDLQGRRIRHSRTEQQLAEWQSQAHERELEKIAQKHIKELAKEQKREAEAQVDVDKIAEDQKQAIARVQNAVQDALASGSTKSAKRVADAPAANAAKPVTKKAKMLAMVEEIEDSDDDSDGSSA